MKILHRNNRGEPNALGKLFLVVCLLSIFLLAGCTQSETILIKDLKHPHLFGMATTIQHPIAVGVFQEIVFDYDLGDYYEFTPDGSCILVERKGHYLANFEVFFQDNAVASDTTTVAIMISQNGSEVSGSYSEINLDKQWANQQLTTFAFIDANIDDRLCIEWVASKVTTDIAMENNYSVQPITAKGFIEWVHD